jgi:hypothetical protein
MFVFVFVYGDGNIVDLIPTGERLRYRVIGEYNVVFLLLKRLDWERIGWLGKYEFDILGYCIYILDLLIYIIYKNIFEILALISVS